MIENVDDALDSAQAQAQESAERERALELLRVIEFSMEVQKFIDGPIGQRLLADTQAQLAAYCDEYVQLDPDDDAGRKRMRELKLQIGICEHWQQLLAAYIAEGKAAEVEFHEGEFVP